MQVPIVIVKQLNMEDRSRWIVADYQRALAARGAKVKGRKWELIERLEAYERNDNFGVQPIIAGTADPLPDFPDVSKFRTLTQSDQGELPKIMAKSHVEQYVLYRQNLGPKKEGASAIGRGEKMSGEVLALSFFLESAAASTSSEEASNQLLYITGIVRAEMKKAVTYSMKLVMDGETGEVLQAHCECPAGRGPTGTCKHTVVVLLVLVKFAQEGTLQVQHSCTDQLQTFKKPSGSHHGSPVRAENLGKGYPDRDPRQKFRNWEGYKDHVNNATINFCAQTGLDITMRYAIGKADLAAAQLDHDYLKRPFVEY